MVSVSFGFSYGQWETILQPFTQRRGLFLSYNNQSGTRHPWLECQRKGLCFPLLRSTHGFLYHPSEGASLGFKFAFQWEAREKAKSKEQRTKEHASWLWFLISFWRASSEAPPDHFCLHLIGHITCPSLVAQGLSARKRKERMVGI